MQGTLTKRSANQSNFRGPIDGWFTEAPKIGYPFIIMNDKPLDSSFANERYVETSPVKNILAQNIKAIVFETESGSVYKLEQTGLG